jgi:CHAD domain-containing protein
VANAFRVIAGECLRHLQANDGGLVSSDELEYVHQARVAIRRLRCAFGLFGAVVPKAAVQPLLARVKALGSMLGAARDWDVFVAETLPPVIMAFPGHPGFEALLAGAGAARAAAREQARGAITAPDYTALLLDLGAQLAGQPWREALDEDARSLASMPVGSFAALLLDRQWKRVRRAGKQLRELEPAQLHALRIEVKKLRYAIEFFQSLYPRKAVKAFLDQAAELQAILGALNDATVTSQLLGTMAPGAPSTTESAGIVRGWVGAGAHQALAHLDIAWKRFEGARPYW